MESISIDITDFTNKNELFTQDLLKRGIDLTKPFKRIATTVMVPSFQQNFMEQGRPEKWKGLKPETIIARYYRRNKGKGLVSKKMRGMKSVGSARYKESTAKFLENAQILIDTAQLMQSFVRLNSSDNVNRIINKNILEMGSKKVYAATHDMGSEKRNIPARPIAVIQEQDADEANRIIADYLIGEING